MSGLTIISRVAGLVRDKVCSYYIGTGPEWSAFWYGFIYPNLFRRLFGEGALTAVFVPAYTEVLHKQGREAANRLASATVSLLILVLLTLTLVGEAIALPIALSPASSPTAHTYAAMVAIMLPYCVMVCLVALLGAIAIVHERFAAQAISPVILNLAMAGAAALSVWLMTGTYPLEKRIYWVAFSVLIAGVLQVLQMLPTLWRSGVRFSHTRDFRNAGIEKVLKPLLPILLGYSAVQINTAMDSNIATWLSSDGHGHRPFFTLFGQTFPVAMGDGALAKLSIAQRIYLLPVGIFGVSMATAVFQPMARAAAASNIAEIKRLLVAGLEKTLFLSIPASLGMILIAKPLITLIYLGPVVSEEDVERAYSAAIFFCLGIWAFEAQMVILRVFYVLKDTRTPTLVALGMIVLNLGLNVTLVWFLQEGGLALATTIAAVLQIAILLAVLRRRLGALGARGLIRQCSLGLLASVVMIEVGYLLSIIPVPWEPQGIMVADPATRLHARLLTALVKLPLLVVACAGIYFSTARFLGLGDMHDVPFIGRFFRRRRVS